MDSSNKIDAIYRKKTDLKNYLASLTGLPETAATQQHRAMNVDQALTDNVIVVFIAQKCVLTRAQCTYLYTHTRHCKRKKNLAVFMIQMKYKDIVQTKEVRNAKIKKNPIIFNKY